MKNSLMAKIFEGREDKYPYALEQRFQRILDKIADLWGTPAIEDYFNDLMIDRRGNREGFPADVAKDIFALYQLHGQEHAKKPAVDADVWENVGISRDIYDNTSIKVTPSTTREFFKAIEAGDVSKVVVFLQKRMPLDVAGEGGWTPLMFAAFKGREDLALLFLKCGANVHATDDAGYMPLHWAAFEGHIKIVKFLIARGANINARNHYGWTPLLQAAARGHKQIVELLIEHNANVNAADDGGWTPLHKAAVNGHAEIVKLLLSQNANIGAQYRDGSTALSLARAKGHKQIVHLIAREIESTTYALL